MTSGKRGTTMIVVCAMSGNDMHQMISQFQLQHGFASVKEKSRRSVITMFTTW